MEKFIKTSDELVNHMKLKGIKFQITSEKRAKEILENEAYYFKLASYRNNYSKKDNGEYINLEFAYLKELFDIDNELKAVILQMSLDIEQSIKIALLNDIVNNFRDKDYDIVKDFEKEYSSSYNYILLRQKNPYSEQLIDKYSRNLPIWVFLEIISFGDTLKLYALYCKKYKNLKHSKLLYSIRDLRNAAAHNNSLIYKLTKGEKNLANTEVGIYVSNLKISRDVRRNKLSNKFFADFATLLFAYKVFIKNENLKNQRKKELNELFSMRMLKNKHYFFNNSLLVSAYKFCKVLIDNF